MSYLKKLLFGRILFPIDLYRKKAIFSLSSDSPIEKESNPQLGWGFSFYFAQFYAILNWFQQLLIAASF